MSWIWIPISLVAGIVLSLIVVGTMKSKLKTVRFQAAANNYVKAGSMNLTAVSYTHLFIKKYFHLKAEFREIQVMDHIITMWFIFSALPGWWSA